MKVKPGYLFRSIAGSHIVLPTGARNTEFNGMITLNDTGAFLWKRLEKGATEEELAAALAEHFEDVTPDSAQTDVKEFLDSLKDVPCFE